MQRKNQGFDGNGRNFASKGEHLVRKTVDHNYTDYSRVSEGEILDLLKRELPTDTELSGSSHRSAEQTDRDIVGLRKAFGSNQEEVLEELRRQPDMDISEKLRILCDCLRRNTGGISKPFPLKLMEMLANKETQHILSWMPHGRAFKIFNQCQFVDVVLPIYFFNNIKYTSFNRCVNFVPRPSFMFLWLVSVFIQHFSSNYRQLNLWGFKRLTKGQDNGAYYHELFLRGKPLLAMRMKRQRIKGTGVKLSSDPSREPNFYTVDFPPLPEGELPTHCSAPLGDGDLASCPTTLKSDSDDTCLTVEEGEKGREQEKMNPFLKEITLPFKSHAAPNSKSETSAASPPSFSEESAENLSHVTSKKNFRLPKVESSPLFFHPETQRRFSVAGEYSRSEAFVGHPSSSSSSRAVSNFPMLPCYPESEEITEVEFILRKQRQELELLTALTELKKQVCVVPLLFYCVTSITHLKLKYFFFFI
jgi:hypothetical protein